MKSLLSKQKASLGIGERNLGGKVNFKTSQEEGTVFKFSLPYKCSRKIQRENQQKKGGWK
ncbi:MAG: hypothetical protein NT010_01905 [Proteobacteria bacterium]|nr:hypothetical protein [Pseudomonadota bacterium]